MFKQRSRNRGWMDRGSKSNGSRGSFGGGFSGGRSRGGRGGFGRNKPQINIAAFIQKAQLTRPSAPVVVDVVRTFGDFDLEPMLKQNIAKLGFDKPTPIQDQIIDHVMDGRNALGIANTGTGKTGAFLIPSINKMIKDNKNKMLIIAPTRELALQIDAAFRDLTRGLRLFSVQVIGGTNIRNQLQQLTRQYNAVIGTPGRIIDLVDRGAIDLSQFNVVVLDEVDRMLDMGFVNDIRDILAQTPMDRQSLYFSATITPRVSKLINDFSRDVVQVSVRTNETTDSVTQEIIRFEHHEKKMEILHDILVKEEVNKVLIFGKTKHGVKKLMFELRDRGFKTESIHGNKTQAQRQRALKDFKDNRVTILVATDVAARGLDIDDVSHVINYEIPDTFDDYIHRIGRTGRGGKQGIAYTFVA